MDRLPLISRAPRERNFFKGSSPDSGRYLFFAFGFIIIASFFILAARLFQLTVVKGNYYRRLSDENRIRQLIIEPQRGTITDRKGIVIAENKPANIEENKERLTSKRVYLEPFATSHLLGYRQVADQANMDTDPCLNKLQSGDKTGKKGIEKAFDCDLRGVAGTKMIELDAHGKYLHTLAVNPPENGKTLQLALDLDLQKKAYELLKDQKGAVIVLNPQTGEVLALVSFPNYNIQDFEDNSNNVKLILQDEDRPLFNRATEGTYPPGSVFKLFEATGALEDKKIDEKFQVEDTGQIKAGSLSFGNWYFLQYGKTDGMVNVVKGIRRSNDIFFYRVGERLGVTGIKKWAQNFGFGKKIADFPFEQNEGIVPSEFWKQETLKDNWYLGDTYNLAIGQGYLLVTPMQIAHAVAAFANGGQLCKPQLLKTDKGDCQSLNLSKKTLDLVRQGMKEACSAGGTGWPLFDFTVEASGSGKPKSKIQTACKTGTAESHGEKTPPHAWITAYAPYDKPQILVTVLVEEGGQGSDVAGPIAKELLKTYFERQQ